MKKLIKISAAAVAAGVSVMLAGCGGCSGNVKNNALTNSNWYTGTSYKGIQPSFIKDDPKYADCSEKILYDVTFRKSLTPNSSYEVEYTDGSFLTEFYATYYDWNSSIEDYKADKEELVYCYKTELNIKVQFTIKASGDKSEVFSDKVVNECYFRAAGKNLQPVYSVQTVKSTTPANYQATSLDNAYFNVDCEYKNYYKTDCSEVTTVTTETGKQPQTETVGLNKINNSVFDNSSLYIAARSMKLSESLSQNISLYSPAAGGVSAYALKGGNVALGDEERKAVSKKLEDAKLYTPVTKDEDGNDVEDKGIESVSVSVSYAGGSLQGTTQTIWYAAIKDADNNQSRATMLKLSVPLSYNLGVLDFNINEIQSTLWNE